MLRYGSQMYLKKALAEYIAKRKEARFEEIIANLKDQLNDHAWPERTRKIKLLGSMTTTLEA